MNALKWAIQSGNTTKESSGGYGLPMLISYIKAVHGELLIFSGAEHYNLKNEMETINGEEIYFPGTSIIFKVKLFEMDNVIMYDQVQNKIESISLDNI